MHMMMRHHQGRINAHHMHTPHPCMHAPHHELVRLRGALRRASPFRVCQSARLVCCEIHPRPVTRIIASPKYGPHAGIPYQTHSTPEGRLATFLLFLIFGTAGRTPFAQKSYVRKTPSGIILHLLRVEKFNSQEVQNYSRNPAVF